MIKKHIGYKPLSEIGKTQERSKNPVSTTIIRGRKVDLYEVWEDEQKINYNVSNSQLEKAVKIINGKL